VTGGAGLQARDLEQIMTDWSTIRPFAAMVLMLSMTAGAGLTAQSSPLPAFTVAAPGGAAVSSAALSSEPQYVLVYVRPGAVATTRMLEALAAWQLTSEQLRRVVLIVEGPAREAEEFLAGRWKSESVSLVWYADPQGQAAQALGLSGAPALKGVKAGAVEWSLEGVLNDPTAYEPTLRTWIGAR
jgi:hypothetical protein